MSVTDICRLCLSKENLLWIFDKRFTSSESLKDVIYITTGVEVHIKDIISQKICTKCCRVTREMSKFRRTSFRNDKYLREKLKKHVTNNSTEIFNADAIENKIKHKIDEANETKPDISKTHCKIRPSVEQSFRLYPQFQLPTVCLNSDDVKNYFKARKLDFNIYANLALKSSMKPATKKTPATCNILNSCTNNSTTAKVVLNKSESDDVRGPIETKLFTISNFVMKASGKVNRDIENSNIASHNNTKGINSGSGSFVELSDNNVAKTKSGRDIAPENTLANRKRNYPETEETTKQNHKKPKYEALKLPSKYNDTASTSFTKSSTSYLCSICNFQLYNLKSFRKHYNKHLRCQFCKTKFRTYEIKTDHIKNACMVKHMMNNLPDVRLDKIEHNVKVRREYADAVNFQYLKHATDDRDKNLSNTKDREQTTRKDISQASASDEIKPEADGINYKLDNETVIEIISDDDYDSPSTVPDATGDNKFSTALTNQINSKSNSSFKSAALTPQTSSSSTVLNTLAPIPENIVYKSVSIMTPIIKIENSDILEYIENFNPKIADVILLKKLLETKPFYMRKKIQTEFPTNHSIFINRANLTSLLKNLKQQIFVYKIPIVIKHGIYNVSYKYIPEAKQAKKVCLWNDLTPIDIDIINLTECRPNNAKQIINEKNINLNVSSLRSTSIYNYFCEIEKSTNETQIISEKNKIQVTNIPTTATYNIPRQLRSLPQVIVNKSRVKTNFVEPSFYSPSTTSIICNYPVTDSIFQPRDAFCGAETTTPQPVSYPSNLGKPISDTLIPLGLIRVKDVWELS